MSISYYDGKGKRERELTNLSLQMNDTTGRLYASGVDTKTGRPHSRAISKKEAKEIFGLSNADLRDVRLRAVSDTSGANNNHLEPNNFNDYVLPPEPEQYPEPLSIAPRKPKAKLVGDSVVSSLSNDLHNTHISKVYRGPKTKAEREKMRAELMEHFQNKKKSRAGAKAPQKGGLSPGLISGIADGLGKAAEGMHGTFQKGLDNISKQRQREFEKNQMTGWYDRKGARNDRRQGARNMKQIANNMDYIRKEYIKERGIPLTDEQVFQMALEFAGGA